MTRNLSLEWPNWKEFHFQVCFFHVVVKRPDKLRLGHLNTFSNSISVMFWSWITPGHLAGRALPLCGVCFVAPSRPSPSRLHVIILVLISLFNHTDECLDVSCCSAGRPARPQWLNASHISIKFLSAHGFYWTCMNFRSRVIFSHIADWAIARLADYGMWCIMLILSLKPWLNAKIPHKVNVRHLLMSKKCYGLY